MSKYSIHIKQTFKLALPIAIGQVGHVMMGFVDNAVVGNLSPVNLAAASIANGFFFITMVIGIGISYALSTLVSMNQSSGDIKMQSKIFNNATVINFAVGVLLSLFNYYFSNIIGKLSQPPEVVELAIPYCRLIGLTAIPFMMFQNYRQFLEGLSIMRPAMFITLIANIVNLIANFVLVFGLYGFPKMGLMGSGYATMSARIFMALALGIFVYKNRKFAKYQLNVFKEKLDLPIIKNILRIGLGSGFQYFFEVACFVSAAYMVGWLGAKQMAAHQIALNVASLSYMVVIGISSAGAIRVSGALGAKNYAEMRDAGIGAIALAFMYMMGTSLAFVIFSSLIPRVYVHDLEVIRIASQLLIIAAMFQIFDGVQATSLGVLRGINDIKIPTVITFISYWLIGLPAAYFIGFTFNFGIEGIWYGLLIGLIASAILLTDRFLRITKRMRLKTRPA